ncbi:MAG: sulfurtransferase [Anaerolineales bacterium]|nr:MAG: sulfurtransferase [Anaerolineales bacterium]
MSYTTIITPKQLEPHLEEVNWAIFDSRFDLLQPQWGEKHYLIEHIPGAVYVHLDHNLSAPKNGTNGRHPLPDIEVIAEYFSGLGIDDGTQVIVYDSRGGGIAVRLWWMLKYLGHEATAILDGGFPEWNRLGLPVRTNRESRVSRQFKPRLNPDLKVGADEVLERILQDSSLIIDSRAPERYRGEEEPFDPIAGRIPGAVNRFWQTNLDADGRFRDPDVLRAEFDSLISEIAPSDTIVYCGSGVTGCHNVLSMSYAGIQGVRLYAGSWSEWSSDPSRPIEIGAQPD